MILHKHSTEINTTKVLKTNFDFIPIQCLLNFRHHDYTSLQFLIDILVKHEIEPIGKIEQFLNGDLEEQKFKYDMDNTTYGTRGYYSLFYRSTNIKTTRRFWSSDGVIQGNFYFGEFSRHKSIIYNLCVKKKYIRYFLQCVLLEREPDNRIFTLLIDHTFDTTNSIAPRIRPHFRKYVRKQCLNLGIELKYETNLDELFYETFKLEALNPMELKQIKKDLVLELLTI